MATFAERIRVKRDESGLNQTEFAALFGLKQAIYSHYEAGRREPRLKDLATFCRILKVSADWLLGLPERDGVSLQTNGDNSPIAINSIVKQQTATPSAPSAQSAGDLPLCRKCPYKLDAETLYKISDRRKK